MFTTYEIVPEKLLYYFAPKCGSRTILGYAYYFKHGCMPENNPLVLIRENIQSTRNNPEFYEYRVCVVRDPIKRFISAYDNHINIGIDRTDARYITVDDIIGSIQDPNFKKTNSRFMYYIQSQTSFYGNNNSIFTHIFNVDGMNKLKALIEEVSGENLPQIHLNKSIASTSTVLNDMQANWIKREYSLDYDIYGKWM